MEEYAPTGTFKGGTCDSPLQDPVLEYLTHPTAGFMTGGVDKPGEIQSVPNWKPIESSRAVMTDPSFGAATLLRDAAPAAHGLFPPSATDQPTDHDPMNPVNPMESLSDRLSRFERLGGGGRAHNARIGGGNGAYQEAQRENTTLSTRTTRHLSQHLSLRRGLDEGGRHVGLFGNEGITGDRDELDPESLTHQSMAEAAAAGSRLMQYQEEYQGGHAGRGRGMVLGGGGMQPYTAVEGQMRTNGSSSSDTSYLDPLGTFDFDENADMMAADAVADVEATLRSLGLDIKAPPPGGMF